MSQQETTSQDVTAVTVDSAPTETQVQQEQPAVEQADSAPATETQVQEETPEQSKAVKELIAQRKKRQQAEQDAAYWRGVAEAKNPVKQEQNLHPAPAVNVDSSAPVEPDSNSFDSFEAFEKAKENYIIEVAQYRMRQEFFKIEKQKEEAKVLSTFKDRLDNAAKTDPSIYEIANDRTLPISEGMLPIIQTSEVAPEMIKWLHNNRHEALRIAQLPPIYAARELGAVEAQLRYKPQAEPPKKISQAPAPIQTVTPSGSPIVDEADLPMDQFFARRNKAQYGR